MVLAGKGMLSPRKNMRESSEGRRRLDEPANGLDISAKQALQSMIASNVNEEQTVIISTHTVNDFTNLFDGVIVLSRSHMLMAMNAKIYQYLYAKPGIIEAGHGHETPP